MTKQEKIKEEWLKIGIEDLEQIYGNNSSGWRLNVNAKYDKWDGRFEVNAWFHRPKSLTGIENNNGWIKIESEEDFPTEYTMYRIGFFKKDGTFYQDDNIFNLKTTLTALNDLYTHYQPSPKPESPLF